MFERDFADFTELLDGAFSLNPTWKPLSPKGKALFFKALEPFPFDLVSQAMTAHIRDPQRGKFQPTPADLISQIDAERGSDGRPAADEAWALVQGAVDESATVVWTEEMRDAFAICRPVLESGDKVGARMAFKDAYTRLAADAKRAGRPVKWEVSLGHDPEQRNVVIERAVIAGHLPAPTAAALLPGKEKPGAASIEGLARVKEALAKLTSPLEKAQKAQAARAESERQAIADRKRELADMANQQIAVGCSGKESRRAA